MICFQIIIIFLAHYITLNWIPSKFNSRLRPWGDYDKVIMIQMINTKINHEHTCLNQTYGSYN
jgi:hypothetical protein